MLNHNMTAKRLNSVKEYYFSKKLREVASLIRSGKPIINWESRLNSFKFNYI